MVPFPLCNVKYTSAFQVFRCAFDDLYRIFTGIHIKIIIRETDIAALVIQLYILCISIGCYSDPAALLL